jgi:hypothetical protein
MKSAVPEQNFEHKSCYIKAKNIIFTFSAFCTDVDKVEKISKL